MASSTTPGILHVTMQPHPSLRPAQFHDWYNNEHGASRLRYPFFLNGFRYRATDLPDSHPGDADIGAVDYAEESTGSKELPEWMAIYDVTEMGEMLKAPYTTFRSEPFQTQRERDTMAQIHVDRRFYDLVSSKEGPNFRKLEDLEMEGTGNVMVAVSITQRDGVEQQDFDRAVEGSYLPAITALPGWTRTRRFETSTVDSRPSPETLFLHEFHPSSGFASRSNFVSSTSSAWTPITSKFAQQQQVRTYRLFYTFGPGPRDLGPLSTTTYDCIHTHGPHRTRTVTASSSPTSLPSITSYITTSDGTVLPYTLTGASNPSAPLIVLSNSILTRKEMWSAFLAAFFSKSENAKYRILTYNTRGHSSQLSKETPVTIDVLAKDVIALLDALRVKKAKAIVGVSLGGATALCCGVPYRERFEAFVSCDTTARNVDNADVVWADRVAICEKEGSIDAATGEAIVGEEMAEATTRRWFTPGSYQTLKSAIDDVKEMVKTNSLAGFKAGSEALWKYNFSKDIEDANASGDSVKGLYLVGKEDGVLPKIMGIMAETLNGSKLVCIDGAGHLPMVEKPKEVADVVEDFLAGI